MARLDQTKHDFDVLEHVLRGVHAWSDSMPHLVADYPEGAFTGCDEIEIRVVVEPAGPDEPGE